MPESKSCSPTTPALEYGHNVTPIEEKLFSSTYCSYQLKTASLLVLKILFQLHAVKASGQSFVQVFQILTLSLLVYMHIFSIVSGK